MPDWLRVVLAVLAAYRLAHLVTREEGPANLFERLRTWAGAYDYGEDGQPFTSLGRGISCPLCVGVWAAALCVGLALLGQTWATVLVAWLGVAGGQALIEEVLGGWDE